MISASVIAVVLDALSLASQDPPVGVIARMRTDPVSALRYVMFSHLDARVAVDNAPLLVLSRDGSYVAVLVVRRIAGDMSLAEIQHRGPQASLCPGLEVYHLGSDQDMFNRLQAGSRSN